MRISFAIVCFVLVAGTAAGVRAQSPKATANLQQQVNVMGQAFLKGDYKTFADYTYPGLLKMMGGKDKMETVMKGIMDGMKSSGMKFNKISFDAPGKIVKVGKQLQGTVIQHLDIKLTKGGAVSTSALIAISDDDGDRWTFIDTQGKDIAAVKKAFPEISAALVLPPPQKPVQYN